MEALLLRVVDGDLDAVEAYLKYNGDPNAVFMHRGRHHSLLEVAAASGNEALAELLLQRGAVVDLQVEEGNTALMHATYLNHPAVVRRLLRAGANATLRNTLGETAIWIAKENEHAECVEAFRQHVKEALRRDGAAAGGFALRGAAEGEEAAAEEPAAEEKAAAGGGEGPAAEEARAAAREAAEAVLREAVAAYGRGDADLEALRAAIDANAAQAAGSEALRAARRLLRDELAERKTREAKVLKRQRQKEKKAAARQAEMAEMAEMALREEEEAAIRNAAEEEEEAEEALAAEEAAAEKAALMARLQEAQAAEAQSDDARAEEARGAEAEAAAWWEPLLAAAGGGAPAGLLGTPRPLVNCGNTCFANSTLQALLACGPFRALLSEMARRQRQFAPVCPPGGVALSFSSFYDAIAKAPAAATASNVPHLQPATYFERPLRAFRTGTRRRGGAAGGAAILAADTVSPPSGGGAWAAGPASQEDAEEWLSFALDQLHEELLDAARKAPPPQPKQQHDSPRAGRDNGGASGGGRPHEARQNGGAAEEEEGAGGGGDSDGGGEWLSVGKGSKVSTTRTMAVASSPVRAIFSGMVCNRVEAREDEDGKVAKPSNTIEPFTCLNLDIDRAAIRSLDDALDAFFDKQSLEDFKIRGKSASASKQPLLQALPSVLVLHLKRFTYDQHGSHKVLRHLSFEQTLRVQRSHLADGCAGARPKAAPAYTLVAVVAHHGHTLGGGHYTCDVHVPSAGGGTSEWYHCDDNRVRKVKASDVMQRQAYVLFYERAADS